MANQIRTAVQADTLKQCFTGTTTALCSDVQFESEVSADIDFARQRGQYVLAQLPQISAEQLYSFTNPGQYSISKSNASSKYIDIGYGIVDPDIGSGKIDAFAVFSYRQNGVTISETGLPAA